MCCVGQFMVVLDGLVVNVALPQMSTALRLGASGQQWVINAYLVPCGGLLLLASRAADRLGHRRMFLAGLAVFTLASLAGGLPRKARSCWAPALSRGWAPRPWRPRH